MNAKDCALGAAVVTAWGMNFLLAKLALAAITPAQLGLLRFVFAALPLVLLVPLPTLPARVVVAYGLLQGFGQFACLFAALQLGLGAAMASVLMQSQVFFTPLLAFFCLGERLHRRAIAATVAGALALVVLALPDGVESGVPMAAVLFAVAAALAWSVSNIVLRRAALRSPGFSVSSLVGWGAVVSVVPFAFLSLWVDAQPLFANPAILSLDVLATATAYVLWGRLLQRHSASRVAPLSLGVPLVGVLAAVVLLDERLTNLQWVAAAFLLAAVVISVWDRKGVQA
jgi:O-acetylserine/cysteine efflux transporter